MEKSIRWLRTCYWIGAIVDGLVVLLFVFPNLFAVVSQISNFHPGREYRYMAGTAAALMLGWTVLLLWADRKPVERKGILIITIVPVLVGLVIVEIWAVASGFVAFGPVLPIWLLQIALMVLYVFSYLHAGGTRPFSHVKKQLLII